MRTSKIFAVKRMMKKRAKNMVYTTLLFVTKYKSSSSMSSRILGLIEIWRINWN